MPKNCAKERYCVLNYKIIHLYCKSDRCRSANFILVHYFDQKFTLLLQQLFKVSEKIKDFFNEKKKTLLHASLSTGY